MIRTIVVFLFLPITLFAQNRFEITGTITSDDGQPLAFASIALDKNNKYAIAENNGSYRIPNVKTGEYMVTVSSLGFETVVRTITVDKDLKLDFVLAESAQQLDDVIVQGKKTATEQAEKAITIGSFELADIVAQTNIITDAIDRISGVRIRRSGSLGDNSDISINGLNGTAVRVYIDGIPLEFLYPGLDLATLPLTDIKRVDVYKGVLPVDIGTDALGGGINIITETKYTNRIKASYSLGSFNTHLADINMTLTDGNDNFLSLASGINYSDNDYTFRADLLVNNPFASAGAPPIEIENQNIRRFHDMYRLQYTSASLGTTNKSWTDNAQINFNYLNSFREIQNGLQITNLAFGEAVGERENVSVVAKYDKTILKDKLKLRTVTNYSDELIKFVDTTANAYNWLGEVIFRNRPGEFNEGTPALTETTTKSVVNRTSLNFDISENNRLILSNLLANQRREIKDFDINEPTEFEIIPEQKITKNITGLQYEGGYLDNKLEFSSALKYYTYNLSAIEFNSQQIIEQTEGFFGWNAGLKYTISDNLSIRGSYERGFLIPEIFQFAGNATGIVPNGEIAPEESDNYNLGLLFSKQFNDDYAFSLTTNAFIRNQRDIIFLDVNRTPLRYVNAEDVSSKGIEGELKFNFLKNFDWTSNVSYIDKIFVSFVNSGVTNDFLVDSPFPNTPSFFFNTELSWSKDNFLNTGVGVRLYGLFNHVDSFNFVIVGAGDTIETNPNAFVPEQNRLDAGFSLRFFDDKFTAAFNVVNITDEDLFDNFSIPRPGRNYNFKLIYEISNF
ncbi:TonB-dependent receptor [Flagellimonas sp. HMM57]|uniref:TonB-dependent receptor n=1 Tax=unclassified Flagellimonas TaxID=2644544 RepID=UPI0013D478F5|nr:MULTISPECIES: TonB-dependent receptor [unclassified Flagellimonas]UII77074.1 TonB-dependent receptor [Flagellimonas sp. HMM57]